MNNRIRFYIISIACLVLVNALALLWTPLLWLLALILPLVFLGLWDIVQPHSNVLRNYPLWGHWRYILLSIRPQIQEYYIVNDQNGRPFNREMQDLVSHRATKSLDELPFGSQLDMGNSGYEWINHSMTARIANPKSARVTIGNHLCKQPYFASRLNISAMSYGALSQNAIRALNRGAKLGGFAHNTGEGGLSAYHLSEGGDLIWQIGTGYFGCRTETGGFCKNEFAQKSKHERVKMIEIKLSQGAKPGHGGILPAPKVTAEIASARLVERHVDCISPPGHSEFSTPAELIGFVQKLRELSGGKPIGFKLCLGARGDFMSICKAMLKTEIYPDFITVDGGEGGTGAAPVEFSDFVGTPLNDGLIFIHNALVGCGIRHHIKLIASGKIISGFDMISKIALGADLCNSARGMMFALGCVQSRRCHSNTCPTGIATQDPARMYGLNVATKSHRVCNYHAATISSFLEVLGAAGLEYPEHLTSRHIHRRVEGMKEHSYREIYAYVTNGSFLDGSEIPEQYRPFWEMADADAFPSFETLLSNHNQKNDITYRRYSEFEEKKSYTRDTQ